MRIVFMGTPDFAAGILEALLAAGHEIPLVVTKKDKPFGRGKKEQSSAVKRAAQAHELAIYQPDRIRSEEAFATLEEIKPDIIVVAAFGQLIPKSVLDLPKYGCINVHASLLPAYRGAAPIQWAVIRGEKESGVTIMQMDEGLDTGDMLAKSVITLDPEETGGSLFDRLSEVGARLLVETIPRLEKGEIIAEKQPKESTTPYARMIQKKDGRIDWSKSAIEVERLVRGMNPWPSAFTMRAGKLVKLWKVTAEEGNSGAEPGTVCEVTSGSFCIAAGEGKIRVLELQLEGKRRIRVDEFLRGYQLKEGELFSSH